MSVQLEAFEASIKSRRMRWFLTPNSPIAYPPGFQEQIYTEITSLQRKILLTSHQSSEAWKLVDRWDTVFIPQTPMDWSLILAFLQNTPTPSCILITPEVQVPVAFYQKSQQHKTSPTIIAVSMISSASVTPLIAFDATFFPPAKELEGFIDQTTLILQSLLTADILRSFVLKDAIRDLKSAGATIVVSSIEESKSSLYWYYTSESHPKGTQLLDTVIQTILKRQN